MDRAQFAARLAALGDDAERQRLLRAHADDADVDLARALNRLYQQTRLGDAALASGAAAALRDLATLAPTPEIAALADWTSGMAAVHLEGQMEQGVALLSRATQGFTDLARPLDAAATQVAALHGLAMLGRYDQAIACGQAAHDTFVRHGDLLAAGKIQQNLGNIAYRRGRFSEAEALFSAAHDYYLAVGDEQNLAQIDNNLGAVLMEQQRFGPAEQRFTEALTRAQRADAEVTRTEIEYNLGCLGLFQGRYDRALEHLEQARRAFARLGMAYRSARAELELADAYLELNLAREAAEIAPRVARTFDELGMRAEHARALGCEGRALALLGETDAARRLVRQASEVYAREGNAVDAAFMTLAEAQLLYAEGEYAEAAAAAERAEGPFAEAGTWNRRLLARWLRGEAQRLAGRPEARAVLESTLADAEAHALPQITARCLTSLGQMAQAEGDPGAAQQAFLRSVAIIEQLRSPLPAEEFRVAYFSDKLTPYTELVRLGLRGGDGDARTRSLEFVERSRSRALVDQLAGVVKRQRKPRNADEADLIAQLEQVRSELTWYYGQINRPQPGAARTAEAMAALHEAVRQREATIVTLRNRIVQRGGDLPGRTEPFDVERLRRALGHSSVLVEYFSLDGQLLAFVVGKTGVEVVEDLARESEIEAIVAQLRFQIDSVRYGGERIERHMPQLLDRARYHLRRLYDALLRPLERLLGERHLVVVPHRALHYVPFHALFDGEEYVIETRAVSYAPSASVLVHSLEREPSPLEQAVLVGVADEQVPEVHREVASVAGLFPRSVVLLDDEATLDRVREEAARADVLHLACHGLFRPDNPLFSSLHLGDGWMTVRDAYGLDLRCGLVTLSACETGVSEVAPGEELIGLARGFFSAGTASLLVSLWTADDASTAELMSSFYSWLRLGYSAADALREAQMELIARHPHPYHWAAFVLAGRW